MFCPNHGEKTPNQPQLCPECSIKLSVKSKQPAQKEFDEWSTRQPGAYRLTKTTESATAAA